MNGGVLDAQLRAIRAQLVASLTFIDLLLEPQPEPPRVGPVPCPHPERDNISTMGNLKYRCRQCLAILEPQNGTPPREEVAR